jgi:quercetin dioxygenase-like cupin family protein
MATPPTGSGEIIDVGPLGTALDGSKIAATALVKAATLEVVRLVVPAGKDIASHTAPGDVTVQCLEGAVDFMAGGRTHRLTAGRLVYLSAGALHALHGVEDASVLVTIARCDRGGPNAG